LYNAQTVFFAPRLKEPERDEKPDRVIDSPSKRSAYCRIRDIISNPYVKALKTKRVHLLGPTNKDPVDVLYE